MDPKPNEGDLAVAELKKVLPPPPPATTTPPPGAADASGGAAKQDGAVAEKKKEHDPFAGKSDVEVVLETSAGIKETAVNGTAELFFKLKADDEKVKELTPLSWYLTEALKENASWIAPYFRKMAASGKWALAGACIIEAGGILRGLRAVSREKRAADAPPKKS